MTDWQIDECKRSLDQLRIWQYTLLWYMDENRIWNRDNVDALKHIPDNLSREAYQAIFDAAKRIIDEEVTAKVQEQQEKIQRLTNQEKSHE